MEPEEKIQVVITAPIQKGSIVIFSSDSFEEDMVAAIQTQLRFIAGHERFLLMQVGTKDRVGVFGPDDLADAIRQLAKEALGGGSKESTSSEKGSTPSDLGAGHGNATEVPVVRRDVGPEGGTRRK
jgi:hypothetical protein